MSNYVAQTLNPKELEEGPFTGAGALSGKVPKNSSELTTRARAEKNTGQGRESSAVSAHRAGGRGGVGRVTCSSNGNT